MFEFEEREGDARKSSSELFNGEQFLACTYLSFLFFDLANDFSDEET